ncbi:nuclear autoantigenic sperm protein isoform X1 [Sigmodon hispidus]
MKDSEESFTEYEKEIEELSELLRLIREQIDNAKKSQHNGNVAELTLKATLVESSSSGFIPIGAGVSVSMITSRKPTDGTSLTYCMTDISLFVRKKRKSEKEGPLEKCCKERKQEPELKGGRGNAVPRVSEVSENMEAEAQNKTESQVIAVGTVEVTAAVEGTAC